jgi:hypothetical protein
MKLVHYFYIVVLGIFLLPVTSYGCVTSSSKSTSKTEKSCCKETTKTKKAKSCCDDQKSDRNDEPCGGKCGHSNCTSPASQSSMTFSDAFEMGYNLFAFSTKETNFNYTLYNLSSGYVFLWLIPKIS